jgi:hypothetical protein
MQIYMHKCVQSKHILSLAIPLLPSYPLVGFVLGLNPLKHFFHAGAPVLLHKVGKFAVKQLRESLVRLVNLQFLLLSLWRYLQSIGLGV